MENLKPSDDLAGLRKFLKALELNTKSFRAGVDVTKQEIHFLKLQIALLEKVLARPEDGDA